MPLRFPSLRILRALAWLSLAGAAPSPAFDLDVLGLQSEDFFLPPPVGIAALSRDGARYAYSSYRSHGHWIDIHRAEDNAFEHSTRGEDSDTEAVTYLAWKDDRRLIFQTNQGDIYLYDLEERTRILLFDSMRVAAAGRVFLYDNFSLPRPISLLPDDPEAILVSAFDSRGVRQVYRVPLEAWDSKKPPKPSVKNPSGFNLWGCDPSGEVRLGMKFSAKGAKLFYASGDGRRWASLDALGSGKTARAFDLGKANVVEPRDYLVCFEYDKNSFLFASNRDTDTAAIYRFRLDSQSVEGPIASDPRYDLVDPLTGACHPLASEARQKIVGFKYDAETPRVLWIDDDFAALQARVDALLPEAANLLLEWDEAESIFLVQSVSGSKPHEIYLYRKSDDSLARIGPNRPIFESAQLRAPRPFSIDSRDGARLHGYYTPPADSARGEPPPLVALVHGGPWARDSFGFDPFAQCLSRNGFAVLQVNFRGSLGYGYRHYMAIRQDFGLGALDDIEDAVDWHVDQGLADGERVAIMGFSYGGYAAALAAALKPDSFRCAVPISGIYDLEFETKRLKQAEGSALAFEHWKRMVASDWKDSERLGAISPAKLAERIQIPLLIAHGEFDDVAVYEHAERLRAALEKAGNSSRLIKLKGEGHTLSLPRNQAYLLDQIVAFLGNHMQASP